MTQMASRMGTQGVSGVLDPTESLGSTAQHRHRLIIRTIRETRG